jgi:hypothetical protein
VAAVQQRQRQALKDRLATEGISWEEYRRTLADAHKAKWDVIKEVAWRSLKETPGGTTSSTASPTVTSEAAPVWSQAWS